MNYTAKAKFIPWIVCLLFILLMVYLMGTAKAEEWTDNQIANAIYRTENSIKYPYGIKSVKTMGNATFARKVCLNSIRNARKRYSKAKCQGDFIAFMGLRYSPPNINPNWVRLVHHFLSKNGNKGRKG